MVGVSTGVGERPESGASIVMDTFTHAHTAALGKPAKIGIVWEFLPNVGPPFLGNPRSKKSWPCFCEEKERVI